MKKKNKKNQIRMRFSTILLCILTISLCAAPALHASETVIAGQTKNIDYTVTGILWIYGTANLLTGASAQYIYVQNGGTLNMYSGTIGGFINVSPDAAGMTVYGTEFAVNNGTIQPDGNWTLDGIGTLTGYYEDTSPINLLILSDIDIPIHLQPPPSGEPKEITIDIKPGGNPNNINLKSKGVVSVAVLTTGDFDASDVEPSSVVFAGAKPVRWTLEDVDDDGAPDMLFHFKTQDLVDLDENSTEAMLTCKVKGEAKVETTNEEVIQGTDTVRILPQKKK